MSKEQARIMRFMLRYPNDWHLVCKQAHKTIKQLTAHGLTCYRFDESGGMLARLAIGDYAHMLITDITASQVA